MPGADGMNSKFMKNAFVGWTFTAGLYYPPDFDASKLMPMKALKPKGAKREQVMNIRMMFPFTMVCDACQEYNYTGTKFTAKVEQIKHESHLGIKVYRFYGRCRHCWAEFTFKTDPKNSDYTMESGGKRTYEAWKDADMMENEIKKEKEKEAELDQMKALEQKTVDVQAEMQRLEDLDAIRTVNKRLGARDQTIEEALDFLFQRDEREAKAEEQLAPGDVEELEGFREAQEERRRQHLEQQVEAGGNSEGGAENASSSTSAGGGAPASGRTAADAISLAVQERASSQAAAKTSVGARFSVKRKSVADEEAERKKLPRSDSSTTVHSKEVGGDDAVAEAAVGPTVGCKIGLLGAYDSDTGSES